MKSALPALALLGAVAWAADPAVLIDNEGSRHSVPLDGQITAVVFISSVCPISNEYVDRMIALWREFSPHGVRLLFVNSNVNETARDVRAHASAAGFPFPVYRDIRNGLADRLRASITPEAFLLDASGTVRYEGAFDDARNPARVKVQYLKQGVEALLAGKPVPRPSAKATGCTIKREKKSS